jgi:hypothetical protein
MTSVPTFRAGQRVTDIVDGRHGTIVAPMVDAFTTKLVSDAPIATVRFVGTRYAEPVRRSELTEGWE